MTWTEKELERYKRIVCSALIAPSCGGCPRTEEDIDNCYQEIRADEEEAEE